MRIFYRGNTWTEKKRGTPEQRRRPLTQAEYRARFIQNEISRKHQDWDTYNPISRMYLKSVFSRWANAMFIDYKQKYDENTRLKNAELARRSRKLVRSPPIRNLTRSE